LNLKENYGFFGPGSDTRPADRFDRLFQPSSRHICPVCGRPMEVEASALGRLGNGARAIRRRQCCGRVLITVQGTRADINLASLPEVGLKSDRDTISAAKCSRALRAQVESGPTLEPASAVSNAEKSALCADVSWLVEDERSAA